MPAADPRDPIRALSAYLAAGQGPQALALAERLIGQGLTHPLPLQVAASARRQAGQLDEAVRLFERCAALLPGRPGPLNAIAECHAAAGRPDEARRAYADALAADPADFQAGFGLATLALETGDLAAAAACGAALRQAHPANPGAAWLGARIAMASGDPALAEAATAALATRHDVAGEQRAEVLLLRGEALDALGRTHEAFAAAVEGKAIQRAVFASQAAGREGEVAKLRRLKAWFEAADTAPWRAAPGRDARPGAHVFLVGFPRSGTTLLEQVLAGHPDVTALEEAPTLAGPYAEYMTDDEGLERLSRLTRDEADRWRGRYWESVRSLAGTPRRVFLDKAPAGTLYLPLIAKLFPEARILFAVRDPRDVVLSCLRNSFQLNAMTYAFTDLAEAAACYDACMGLAEVYRRVLPLAVRETRHEALVEDFDRELADLAAFLGIAVTRGMADVAATARSRSVRTPSARQVRQGLNRTGVGRWQRYAGELAPVLPVLEPWVRRFGYEA